MGIHEELNLLENNLEKLKREYEQYFAGALKIEPNPTRSAVERLIRKWASQAISKPADRFRYRNLVSRFNSLNELWNRRMRLRDQGLDQARAGGARRPSTTPAPPPKPAGRGGKPRDDIYSQYVSAKKQAGEGVEGLNRNSFQKILDKKKQAILKKSGVKDVEFRVAVEDGKAKLKAKIVR